VVQAEAIIMIAPAVSAVYFFIWVLP